MVGTDTKIQIEWIIAGAMVCADIDPATARTVALRAGASICEAIEAAAPDTKYRPRVPSVEQVRAHEQVVPEGTWQIMYSDKPARFPEWRQLSVRCAGETSQGQSLDVDTVVMASAYGWLPVSASEGSLWRPVTKDGTPVDWRTLEVAQ